MTDPTKITTPLLSRLHKKSKEGTIISMDIDPPPKTFAHFGRQITDVILLTSTSQQLNDSTHLSHKHNREGNTPTTQTSTTSITPTPIIPTSQTTLTIPTILIPSTTTTTLPTTIPQEKPHTPEQPHTLQQPPPQNNNNNNNNNNDNNNNNINSFTNQELDAQILDPITSINHVDVNESMFSKIVQTFLLWLEPLEFLNN